MTMSSPEESMICATSYDGTVAPADSLVTEDIQATNVRQSLYSSCAAGVTSHTSRIYY